MEQHCFLMFIYLLFYLLQFLLSVFFLLFFNIYFDYVLCCYVLFINFLLICDRLSLVIGKQNKNCQIYSLFFFLVLMKQIEQITKFFMCLKSETKTQIGRSQLSQLSVYRINGTMLGSLVVTWKFVTLSLRPWNTLESHLYFPSAVSSWVYVRLVVQRSKNPFECYQQ